MRGRICVRKASESYFERTMRSSVWQPTPIEQLALLLIGAGNARQPFAIGQLRGEVCGLVQLEVQRRGFLLRDFDGVVMVQFVADRAHVHDVLTWIQLARRE